MSTRIIGHVAGSRWHYGTYVSRGENDSIVLGEGVPPTVYAHDFYINTTTGDYFECTGNTSDNNVEWHYAGTMQGPQGGIGPQGVQGPEGRVYVPEIDSLGNLSWSLSSSVVSSIEPSNIRGPAFNFDAVGTFSDRPVNAETGYAYLVTSGVDGNGIDRAGFIYIKTDTGWSDPFPFKGDKGDKGDTGTVFIPSITSEGILSWSNEGGLENPTSVSIRGPQGEQGVSIESAVQNTVNVLSGEPNVVSFVMTDSTVSTFTIYNGAKGDPGVSISTVTADTTNISDGVNTVTIALTDGTSSVFEIRNGSRGEKGTKWIVGNVVTGGIDGISFSVENSSLATNEVLVGDFYLNRDTAMYYICDDITTGVSTSWHYLGTMKGDKGEMGAFFTTGTAGLFDDRDVYDGEEEGFCYYAYDQGIVYVHTAETQNADNAWDSGHTIVGEKGEDGVAGAVFVPNITSGILSWNNNGGYTNPSPVNLMTAGANLVCSPTPPERPHNGMLWVKTSSTEKNININELNVIVASSTPVSAKNGDLWISSII